MSTDTGRKLRDGFGALLGPDMDATALALIDNMLQIRYNYTRGALSAANADATLTSTHSATLDPGTSVRMKVESCAITMTNALTAANTDVAVFTLAYNNANGGSDTTIATINTAVAVAPGGTGNLTAGVPYSIALTDANTVVPSGSALVWKITKAGNGIGLGTYSLTVKAKPI